MAFLHYYYYVFSLNRKDTVIDDISHQLATKYNKDLSNVEVSVDQNTTEFAKGNVRFKDEFGGAIWFGAKQDGKWILASDGQGPMLCQIAEKYSFPEDLVPSCIDNQGNLVTR